MFLQKKIKQAISNACINYSTGGYEYATKSKNKFLFTLLRLAGFFKLFTSNNGNMVYIHQIVAFAHYGVYWLKHGYEITQGTYEVHHLNSCVTDNRPENLQIVSCADHRAIHNALNQNYLGKIFSPQPTPINSQGQLVKNHKHFLTELVKKSLEATIDYAEQQGVTAFDIKKTLTQENWAELLLNLPPQLLSHWWCRGGLGWDWNGKQIIKDNLKKLKKQVDSGLLELKELGVLVSLRFIIPDA